MNHRRSLAAVCALGLLCLSLGGCAHGTAGESPPDPEKPLLLTNETAIVYDTVPEYVFTYAENQTEDFPTTQGAYRFAQLINERTQGRIQVRVYANSQLGDENSTLEQLRFGGIDFVRCSLPTLTPYSHLSMVLMLPYLYNDADHMWAVLDGEIGEEVASSFENTGIIPLSWYDAGVRSFYFTSPVRSLEEMKGLVIRVQPNEMMEDMVRLLGATPLPVSYENVYSAIHRGDADGAENNWSSYDTMRHNEVAPYYLLDEHMRLPEMQMISAVTWSQLSEEDRTAVRECARLSAEYERMLWNTREEAARARDLKAGSVEIALPEKEKQKFRDAVEPLYRKYCEDHMDIVRQIRELGTDSPK